MFNQGSQPLSLTARFLVSRRSRASPEVGEVSRSDGRVGHLTYRFDFNVETKSRLPTP